MTHLSHYHFPLSNNSASKQNLKFQNLYFPCSSIRPHSQGQLHKSLASKTTRFITSPLPTPLPSLLPLKHNQHTTKMLHRHTLVLRTARVLFRPSLTLPKRPNPSTIAAATKAFSSLSLAPRRPMPAMATMGMLRAARQSRGMKVRSSVKKMCEGCKVRSFTFAGMGGWDNGMGRWRVSVTERTVG